MSREETNLIINFPFFKKNKLNARDGYGGLQSKARCDTCVDTIFTTLNDAITALFKALYNLKSRITEVENDIGVSKVLSC